MKDPLLGVEVRRGRAGGLRLQRLVQPLMRAILLRTPGPNALVGDAELEPPDVQVVEAVNPGRGERGAVVTADRVRQAAGAEELAEGRCHTGPADIEQPLATEQVAAEVIDDRKRVAVDSVAHAELALEVDGPDLIGRGGVERGCAGMLPGPPTPAMVDVAVARQDVEDGAARRPGPLGGTGAEALQDLPGAPAEPAVFLEDQLDDVGGRLVRTGARGPAVVEQAARAALA